MNRNRVLFLLGIIALLTGLWGGMVRMGITVPKLAKYWSSLHGPILVSGFIGTLITLERTVAIGFLWTYLAPLSTGIGTLFLILGVFVYIGEILIFWEVFC